MILNEFENVVKSQKGSNYNQESEISIEFTNEANNDVKVALG